MRNSRVLILTLIILILTSSFQFAQDDVQDKYALEDYVEVINPNFGTKNEVIIRENLFISMNLKTDKELYFSMNKIEEQMDEIYLEQVWNGELEREKLTENITNYILSLKEIQITEESSEEVIALKDEIYLVVREYIDDYLILNEFNKMLNDFVINNRALIMESQEGEVSEEMMKKYNTLKENYHNQIQKFRESKEKYYEYLKIPLIEREAVEATGVVPYYEKYIEGIKPGKYEMIIELKEDEEFITLDNIPFTIKYKENLSEEEIINEVNQSIDMINQENQEE